MGLYLEHFTWCSQACGRDRRRYRTSNQPIDRTTTSYWIDRSRSISPTYIPPIDVDRTDWVNTLRTLVPKAKVALAQEMLMRKAKRKAAHELLYKLMRDAIESILRDSKRVSHLGAYRPYAQALAMILLKLNSCVSGIAKFAGLGPPATAAADAVRGSVDAANSAAAICVNKFTQDNIIVRTRDIGLECARVLEFSKEAKTDMDAREVPRSPRCTRAIC